MDQEVESHIPTNFFMHGCSGGKRGGNDDPVNISEGSGAPLNVPGIS